MRILRRVWIVVTNLLFIAVLCANVLQQSQLWSYSGFRREAILSALAGPIILAILLLIGTALEFFNSRLAVFMNAGLFGFVGLLLLTNVFFERHGPHPLEREQVMLLVVLPCLLVSIVDLILYRVEPM